jgi:hypothetical protein
MTSSTYLKRNSISKNSSRYTNCKIPDFVHIPLINNGHDLQRFEECIGNLATLLGESSDGSDLCEENDFRGVPEHFAINIRKAFNNECQIIPKGVTANLKVKAIAQMILSKSIETNEAPD